MEKNKKVHIPKELIEKVKSDLIKAINSGKMIGTRKQGKTGKRRWRI